MLPPDVLQLSDAVLEAGKLCTSLQAKSNACDVGRKAVFAAVQRYWLDAGETVGSSQARASIDPAVTAWETRCLAAWQDATHAKVQYDWAKLQLDLWRTHESTKRCVVWGGQGGEVGATGARLACRNIADSRGTTHLLLVNTLQCGNESPMSTRWDLWVVARRRSLPPWTASPLHHRSAQWISYQPWPGWHKQAPCHAPRASTASPTSDDVVNQHCESLPRPVSRVRLVFSHPCMA